MESIVKISEDTRANDQAPAAVAAKEGFKGVTSCLEVSSLQEGSVVGAHK